MEVMYLKLVLAGLRLRRWVEEIDCENLIPPCQLLHPLRFEMPDMVWSILYSQDSTRRSKTRSCAPLRPLDRSRQFRGHDLPSCRYSSVRVLSEVALYRLDVGFEVSAMDWLVCESSKSDANGGVVDDRICEGKVRVKLCWSVHKAWHDGHITITLTHGTTQKMPAIDC